MPKKQKPEKVVPYEVVATISFTVKETVFASSKEDAAGRFLVCWPTGELLDDAGVPALEIVKVKRSRRRKS